MHRSMMRGGALLLILAVATLPLDAQIPEAEYAARRDSVAARMGPGVLIAFGAPESVNHQFSFSQRPSFDYLTGFEEPDAVMVLIHDDGVRYTLFTSRPTVRTQFYNGFREDPEQLAKRKGAMVRPLDELRSYVDSLAGSGLPFYELRDFQTYDYMAEDSLTRGGAFVEELRARHPGLDIADLHPVVAQLRARKSPAEVALLRKAIAITDAAHRVALRALDPGAREYEVEAAIEATFRGKGADGPAFSSIVGSGPNSTTLHYVANDRRMEAGEVVVMDIGAQVEGYAADVTRTAPVSGTFSADQRAIYDIVLAAQKAAEDQVGPGVPAAASVKASMGVRLQGLAELGLIQSPQATYDPPWPVDCEARSDQCLQGMLFMIHGISHGIGLEVHDPSHSYFDGTYAPGDVITIEPGVYIQASVLDMLPDTPKNRAFVAAVREAVERYDDIGVRIEDDYLITEDGVERLSAAPREVDAIEAAMAASGR